MLKPLLYLFIFAGTLTAGTSQKNITATRTLSPPRIDGDLRDDAWASAPASVEFLQYDPEEGAQPTESTSVRVLYDDNALYVGMKCYDREPQKIVQQLTRRDRSVQADRVSVIIDSYHDHSTAFLFSGSASGIQSDGILSQDGRLYDTQWDAVWEFDAIILPDGWSAEFKIPFSALRFSRQDAYVWGVNFRRFIARKKETDEWVMVPRSEVPQGTISSVSKMGHLSGISDIHPPLHLELLPYEVSKLNYLPQPSPFPLRSDFDGSAGLDLKYGLTNNFTLDMAVNPDYGQVEVDQAVLNLTVFETFYPEKRPFFLEGAQLFSFGTMFDNQSLPLFYSRRIGKKPSVPAPDPGFNFVEDPQVTRILGAAKVTGRTDNGFTLAALSALTGREDAVEEDLSGHRSDPVTVEPRSSYNIVRLKQEFNGRSSAGMMATGSFRDEQLPSLSGGVDWNLYLGDDQYLLEGYLAGSRFYAAPDAPFTGGAGRIGFARPQGEHFVGFTTYDFSSKNFSVSDLGFYSQPREQGGYSEVIYKEDRAGGDVRRYAIALQSSYRWNWDGANTLNELELDPGWEFKNFWSLTTAFFYDFPAYDDANRGINGLYLRPPAKRFLGTLQTDARQPVVALFQNEFLSTEKGFTRFTSTLQLTLRPSPWFELSPGVTVVRSRGEESWVQSPSTYLPVLTAGGLNLFGDRDVDQFDLSLRGIVTFTRSVSLQFFTQVFLAKGSYSNFRELTSPEKLAPYDFRASPLYENPDFNRKTLNANLAFRWEYLPGSTFYLVWTQARSGDDGLYGTSLSDNLSETFRLPMDNILLAKLSYWWSL